MYKGEELNFKYSGLFQNVQVHIFTSSQKEDKHTVTVEADVKLPILKKKFVTSTEYRGEEWLVHEPIVEDSAKPYRVERSRDHGDVLDPISFLLTLDSGEWEAPSVRLLVGNKVIELDVSTVKNGYEIKRRDKDQRLIVRKDVNGIAAIDIPVPVLGNVSIKRV